MKLWESVIYLSSLRKGLNEHDAKSMIKKLGPYTQSIMRAMGISKERLNKEYSDETLARDAGLAKNDHKEFDRLVRKSEQWFLSRN
jgi:hypothetical protein